MMSIYCLWWQVYCMAMRVNNVIGMWSWDNYDKIIMFMNVIYIKNHLHDVAICILEFAGCVVFHPLG